MTALKKTSAKTSRGRYTGQSRFVKLADGRQLERVTIHLPTAVAHRLRVRAAESERSMSDLVTAGTVAILDGLDAKDAKAKKSATEQC